MACPIVQELNFSHIYESNPSLSCFQDRLLSNPEKFIPSNLFHSIYYTMPNVFSKEVTYAPVSQPSDNKSFNIDYNNMAPKYIPNNNSYSTSCTSNDSEALQKSESFAADNKAKKGKSKLSNQAKKNWSKEEEDQLILTLGNKYKNDWKRVAKQILKIRGRKLGPKKLKDHFKSLTKGSLPKRIKFTHDEDLLIAKYFEQFGADWAKIATFLPSRSAMMIKNRFYSFIRKKNLVNNLLNELTGNENQNSEDYKSEQSEEFKEMKGESSSESAEDHESFISYNDMNQVEASNQFMGGFSFGDEPLHLKINTVHNYKETAFSEFDDETLFMFTRLTKENHNLEFNMDRFEF